MIFRKYFKTQFYKGLQVHPAQFMNVGIFQSQNITPVCFVAVKMSKFKCSLIYFCLHGQCTSALKYFTLRVIEYIS